MIVKDAYFVYFLSALAIFAALSYGVRVATRGVVRSDRVARIGGTAVTASAHPASATTIAPPATSSTGTER